MSNRLFSSLGAMATVLLGAAVATAQDEEQGVSAEASLRGGDASVSEAEPGKLGQPPVELGIFGGVMFTPDDHSLQEPRRARQPYDDVAPEIGGRLGIYPLDFLGLEGEAAVLPTATEDGTSATLIALRLQALLQLPTEYITPFLVVGGGTLSVDSSALGTDTDRGFHFGVGAKVPLTERLHVRLDARDTLFASQLADGTPNFFELLLGLGYGIGGGREEPPPPPPPVPVDTDGDGLTDDVDRCPNEPADTGDGCPVGDSDGDGVLDPVDQCPAEAGTKANGCPDLDLDKDGVMLPADKCPDVAGIAPDGCPDTDADKDGIPVPGDQCPDVAETVNGFQDSDGCPDEVPEKIKEFTGVIRGINFAVGKATIRRDSYRLLDKAADVLTEFESLRIMVTGHTDSTGRRAKNLELSKERAESVKKYLVNRDIDPSRIETAGVGPDSPIADNKTRAGRQQNRRIEFKILK